MQLLWEKNEINIPINNEAQKNQALPKDTELPLPF